MYPDKTRCIRSSCGFERIPTLIVSSLLSPSGPCRGRPQQKTLNNLIKPSAPALQMHDVSATVERCGLLFLRVGECVEQPSYIFGTADGIPFTAHQQYRRHDARGVVW